MRTRTPLVPRTPRTAVRRAVTALAVAALTAALTTATTDDSAQAAPACEPTWQNVPVPEPADGTSGYIGAVAALADGTFSLASSMDTAPASVRTTRWNGKTFADDRAQMPIAPQSALSIGTALSLDSGTSGWALVGTGLNGPFTPRFMRLHDGRWTMTHAAVSPDPMTKGTSLGDVVSLAPGDAWSVGSYYHAEKGIIAGALPLGVLIEHWDGQEWTAVPNPLDDRPGALLRGVTAVSANDIWAVGRQTDADDRILPLAMHYDGTSWSEVPVPTADQSVSLWDVSASGPDDVWAVGSKLRDGTGNEATSTAMHWDGTRWSTTDLPDTGNSRLTSVHAAGAGDVWAAGEFAPLSSESFLHWNGTAWEKVVPPKSGWAEREHNYTQVSGTPNGVTIAAGVVYDTTDVGWNRGLLARVSCKGR